MTTFLIVAEFKSSLATVDLQINSWSTSIHSATFTTVAVVISFAFDTPALLAVSLVIAIILFLRSRRRYSVLLLAAMGGDALIVSMVKTLIQSPRPLNALVYDSGFSFPSGHATGSVVFLGLLTYFTWQHWKDSSQAKAASGTLYVIITLIVGFDRIYLNVHWFSDVLGGAFLGLFWLTFSILVFKYVEKTMKLQNPSSGVRPPQQ